MSLPTVYELTYPYDTTISEDAATPVYDSYAGYVDPVQSGTEYRITRGEEIMSISEITAVPEDLEESGDFCAREVVAYAWTYLEDGGAAHCGAVEYTEDAATLEAAIKGFMGA